jgi:hypothetical protein
MIKQKKKLIAILLCTIFLISSAVSASALSIKNKKSIDSQQKNTQIVTFYRYGPDGSEKQIDLEIDLDKGEYVDLVSKKCDELLKNDNEIQNFFKDIDKKEQNDSGLKFGIFSKVRSWGKGFQFKTKYRLSFSLVLRFLCLCIPKIKLRFERPWLLCHYGNDTNAYTKIIPRFHNFTRNTNLTGNHTLLLHNFIGFTTWVGRFDKIQNDRFPEIVWGRAGLVFAYKY